MTKKSKKLSGDFKPLIELFLGPKLQRLWFFLGIMIPNIISALLEGGSFALILVAFSQFSGTKEGGINFQVPWLEQFLHHMSFTTPLQSFVVWILTAIFLQAIRSSLVFITSYATSNLALKIQEDAQSRVYQQILRLSFPCVNRYRLGDLAEYAKTPSSFIPPFMDALNRCINSLLMASMALFLMLKISGILTLVTLVLFAGFAILQRKIIYAIIRSSKCLAEHVADFSKLTIQTLENLRLVHTYHRQDKVFRDTTSILKDISISSKKLYFWNGTIPSINETIGVISIGSVLITSLFVFDMHHAQGVPYLFTFLMLAYRGSARVQLAVGSLGSMALQVGPILRLSNILQDKDKEYLSLTGRPFMQLGRNLEFCSVSLQYEKHLRPAVKNISFSIPQGKATAIVGPSGGGKSSILDMITRLYEPTSGEILVDGEPLSRFSLESWRHVLGVVSQEITIFNDTVEENIRFGIESATQEELEAAAKLSGAHYFIMNLQEQYKTKLGEKGYKLSGGELQRLSLARALLKNPQILILDEATSSLDSATERDVQRALEQYSRDRTVIIIAHRLSTILFADQILYIEKGTLVESGTHNELIAKQGKYAHLWSLQSQGNHENIVSPV